MKIDPEKAFEYLKKMKNKSEYSHVKYFQMHPKQGHFQFEKKEVINDCLDSNK